MNLLTDDFLSVRRIVDNKHVWVSLKDILCTKEEYNFMYPRDDLELGALCLCISIVQCLWPPADKSSLKKRLTSIMKSKDYDDGIRNYIQWFNLEDKKYPFMQVKDVQAKEVTPLDKILPGITGGTNWDGLIDELVVFNDILTADEIDEIRQGTYGAAPPGENAKCLQIVYLTDTTGFLWYAEASAPFSDDDVIEDVSANSVVANGESVVDPTFYPQGEVIALTGDNAGERRPVSKDVGDEVTMRWPFPNEFQAGDTYTITPGCNKTTDHCNEKYSNAVNFRGFLYIPRPEETVT